MNYLQKKKLAFMSIVNRVKGFLRTITGTLPLTLEGCVDEESILDYTLYGQSVQNGTPTPETPVEVESVGERTKNLFDINNTSNWVQKDGAYAYYPIYVGANKTVIASWDGDLTGGQGFYLCIGNSNSTRGNGNGHNWLYHSTAEYLRAKNTKVTADENGYIYINMIALNLKKLKTLQIEYGSVATEFEPYGYKIPVKVCGSNLTNPKAWICCSHQNGINSPINNQKYMTSVDDNYIEATIPIWQGICSEKFDASQISTIGIKININQVVDEYVTYYFGIQYYDESNNKLSFKLLNSSMVADRKYVFKIGEHFINPDNAKYARICVLSRAKEISLKIYDFYITKETNTLYEKYHAPITTNIYIDEPLRKIGNYADCIDFENSKIIRKIKCIELKKATDKYPYTGKNGAYFADILDGKYSRNQKALCNRNMNWFIGNSNEMWIGVDNTYLYWIGILDYLGFTTITELNEWLYDNPTYVFYASNSPSETPITLPKIPSFKGTTILSAETTIQPNNIEITYYSILKE